MMQPASVYTLHVYETANVGGPLIAVVILSCASYEERFQATTPLLALAQASRAIARLEKDRFQNALEAVKPLAQAA